MSKRKAVAEAPPPVKHEPPSIMEFQGMTHMDGAELLSAARALLKQTRVDNSLLKRLKDAVDRIDGLS